MLVEVTVVTKGDYVATLFELPNGRVIVTSNVDPGWAALFHSRCDWENANGPEDALEEYDSVTQAFEDVVVAVEH